MTRRPLLHALSILVAVALTALLAAGCGSDDDGGGGSASGDPIALLTTAATKQIESADVQMRAAADIPGFPILGDQLSVTASGPIAMQKSGLPTLDWEVMLRAGGQSFPARFTAVDDRAFVDFQGLTYEADEKLIGMLPLEHGGESKNGAMSLRSLGIDPSKWLKNAKVTDGDEIGGDSTRLVTGTVDEQAVLADVAKAAESPDVQQQIEKTKGADALPKLSAENLDRVAENVKNVRVEVNVDDAGYARRVFGTLEFTVPKGVKNAAFDHGEISFELVIEKIGAKVAVVPPANPRPLSDLLDFAGLIFGVEKPSDLWTVPR